MPRILIIEDEEDMIRLRCRSVPRVDPEQREDRAPRSWHRDDRDRTSRPHPSRHYYCSPLLKRNRHQLALIEAATSGNPKFFLGSDSAPHATSAKETDCGCAGCYTGHAAIELYAEAFDRAGALDRLEAFASFYGPDFYRLPRNDDSIVLRRERWQVPDSMPLGQETLTPLRAGEAIQWIVEQ